MKQVKILIAAGGTGGHIYPGIAVAREILARHENAEIMFVGTARGLETKIVPENGFKLALIHSAGLKNVGLAGKLKGAMILPKSFLEARRLLKDFRPDVVVGAGGYVSGPVLLMASLMKIKTLIMDSNALPGFTNRRLAMFVDKAALTFEESLPFFGKKGVIIGNPVRKEFFEIEDRRKPGVFSILIFGGSQGARAINNAMADALTELAESAMPIEITHQTGEADLERISEAYSTSPINDHDVKPFIFDMFAEFGRSNLIICRAGATTCAEIAAAGRAAIMIPLPTAADDHQRKNAEAFVNAGAAKMILQKDLTGSVLANEIKKLINSPETVIEMESKAKSLSRSDAATAAADLIEELAGIRP